MSKEQKTEVERQGFSGAINAVFPLTAVQTCIVHLVRHSLNFCLYKDRKIVAGDLKAVYRAETAEAAAQTLEGFDAKWDRQYPTIAQSRRNNWEQVIPFFAFPQDIRRIIYTTNAIESLNASIRKIIKTRGSFPNDESAIKLIYLAIQNVGERSNRNLRVEDSAQSICYPLGQQNAETNLKSMPD